MPIEVVKIAQEWDRTVATIQIPFSDVDGVMFLVIAQGIEVRTAAFVFSFYISIILPFFLPQS
jgi:hypothetical protein